MVCSNYNKFIKLKRGIPGNREQTHYEDTFGMPMEELYYITMPVRSNRRIISELEFALKLSKHLNGKYDDILCKTLDFLLLNQEQNGVLTNSVCLEAEKMMGDIKDDAKQYRLILAGHAHLDMNWMWGYSETVSTVLATFRTVLNLMKEYPEFCFSQSQAAVYKMVEQYDSEMMEEIKSRIAEGRWESTATAWVEPDDNMPSTESMLRHIQYTREYLSETWGVKDFEVDFLPDTFGHNINVAEINNFGEVKYFYHCRGLAEPYVLYRYRSPSGKEVLAYKEPNWYNSAITPHIGAGIIDLCEKCAGLKTGLVIYGVGDHGGGPTRRDIERAMEMMEWPIYPKITFGTVHEFFHAAESVRNELPVITHEANFFAPGCYTTQSRIKLGNKKIENRLADAETVLAINNKSNDSLRNSWHNVLFTHFHDILTGSCTIESREYAMGVYQQSSATVNSELTKSLQNITDSIDTSMIVTEGDINSQSEGAGGGFGVGNFYGVPSPERGIGKTRIFHIFNTLSFNREEAVEITVWDWTGDLKRIHIYTPDGQELPFELLDKELVKYWDHRYFRILVYVSVPSCGYTTIVLSEQQATDYTVYFQEHERVARIYDDEILNNGIIKVTVSKKTGRITSIVDLSTNEEMISDNKTAGLMYIKTETKSSSAWEIGRYIEKISVDNCVLIDNISRGAIRQQLEAEYKIGNSSVKVIYELDKGENSVKINLDINWLELEKEYVPVLTFEVPLKKKSETYRYDIPAGVADRKSISNDVPGLQFGMTNYKCRNLFIGSTAKYGYRGEEDSLSLTLINTATDPDPTPEIGEQKVLIYVGICSDEYADAKNISSRYNHQLFYQAGYCHNGTRLLSDSFCNFESKNVVMTSLYMDSDGSIHIRLNNLSEAEQNADIVFHTDVKEAKLQNLFGNKCDGKVSYDGPEIKAIIPAKSLAEIKCLF